MNSISKIGRKVLNVFFVMLGLITVASLGAALAVWMTLSSYIAKHPELPNFLSSERASFMALDAGVVGGLLGTLVFLVTYFVIRRQRLQRKRRQS